MKKTKILSIIVALTCLIAGCSCNKVSEENYADAVSTYKNSDAISFTRLETITKAGETTYTRKKTDAKYIFDASKKVIYMQYSRVDSEASTSGGSAPEKTVKYHYNVDDGYFYVFSKVGDNDLTRYKSAVSSYESKINADTCDYLDKDCALIISTNLAPIFNLNEVSNFSISDDGVAKFSAVCPSYEHCSSNSQEIEYEVVINNDGNIGSIYYEILNGDLTYAVKYSFAGYGSNNVTIEFPSDLESYIEK